MGGLSHLEAYDCGFGAGFDVVKFGYCEIFLLLRRFRLGIVLSSSASCMIMSESGLSQKPVGTYVAVARRRRASRLALSV